MPAWVDAACDDFLRRMPQELQLKPVLIPLIKRGKNPDVARIVRDESRKLLAAIPAGNRIVVLDVLGKGMTTDAFSKILGDWMQGGEDISIIIGGPEGVSRELLDKAHSRLSLSELTFPHTLVRVMIVEQLYRAWSLLNGHPYHRG